MAVQISLTDGTTTVNLNTSPVFALAMPLTGPMTEERAIQNLGDGETLATPVWRNVTETIELLITGANAGAVRDSIQSIEKLLDAARQSRVTWRGARVFLTVQFDHDTAAWRSEVLAGRLVMDRAADQIWRTKVEAGLIVTRRPYWEGAETQLSLSSAGTGTPTTGYVTVYNDDDATANSNWFQAAAAQVTGSLPSPLKLEIKNNSGGTRRNRGVFVGNYTHMDPANIDPILRGVEAVAPGASNTWAGTTETVTHRWALSTTLLADTLGQYVRALVAFTTEPLATTLVRGAVQLYDGVSTYTDLVLGEQIRAGGEVILDVGAFPLPPLGYGLSGANLYFALKMKAAGSGGDTAYVDWLQFMPAGHGLFRHLRGMSLAVGILNGESLIDNGIEGLAYTTDGTNIFPWHRPFHAPVYAWPAQINRYRLMVQGNNSLEVGHAYQVKAWYRPRRMTF